MIPHSTFDCFEFREHSRDWSHGESRVKVVRAASVIWWSEVCKSFVEKFILFADSWRQSDGTGVTLLRQRIEYECLRTELIELSGFPETEGSVPFVLLIFKV